MQNVQKYNFLIANFTYIFFMTPISYSEISIIANNKY